MAMSNVLRNSLDNIERKFYIRIMLYLIFLGAYFTIFSQNWKIGFAILAIQIANSVKF